MRSAARQLARLVPTPRSVKPRLLALWECPHCRSPYVQPSDWKVLPSGKISLALRCPDCHAWMSGTFAVERVRELERSIAEGRSRLSSAYKDTVRRNMERELDALAIALDQDLIGADDFLPRGVRSRWASAA